jgi:OmcA/MtrC family decaheme c-type cytochrome
MKRFSYKGWPAVFGTAIVLSLTAAPTKPSYSPRDKAFYAADALVNFVRPGLVFKLSNAKIASDGTITVSVKVTDPQGLGLDRLGVNTPGAVAISFIAATIPKNQTQYTAYTTRTQVSTIRAGASAIQAGTDTGGTFTANADGDYTYKFGTKAPAGFDASATHTIGVYGSRDLTLFDLGTNFAAAQLNFVPSGSAVTTVRDVIRDASCTRCHDIISFHGGSRVGVATCVLCHTPQTTDPDTGNTVDFPVMIHKIHFGSGLPSVRAGKPYQVIGFQNSVSDWSDIVFPADPGANVGTNSVTKTTIVNGGTRRCETCHEQDSGATQAANYMTNPTSAACGACHDNVNFATGENHLSLPQPNDNQCKTCHTPQGELEYDASIKGAHVIATESSQLKGMNFKILNVVGTAGGKPTVTFTVKNNAGNPVPMSELTVTPGRLALVLAGPTSNPGTTSFGADVATGGYVSENATTASCGQDGTCTYTFAHAIPADAKGTFSVGIEGRRGQMVNPGIPNKQINTVSYGGKNVVFDFSVDGSKAVSRRTVVTLEQCNGCHVALSLHGENRNRIEMCVLCHNPSETDAVTRAQSTNAAQKSAPAQGVNFTEMIHRIHTGEVQATENQRPFSVVGFGGNLNTFNDVVFPTFHNNASVGAVNKCFMCHVNDSQEKLPVGLSNVKDPAGIIPSSPAATSACMGCHNTPAAASHATANTTQYGESCTVCHSATSEFAPNKLHITCSTCP